MITNVDDDDDIYMYKIIENTGNNCLGDCQQSHYDVIIIFEKRAFCLETPFPSL